VIVCVCHRVSDRDIEREVRQGCGSFEELQDELRVGTACGRCADCARDTFDVARACRPTPAEALAANVARARPAGRLSPRGGSRRPFRAVLPPAADRPPRTPASAAPGPPPR
jgi:bacterioferritin-associated ferredoxin